MKKIFIIFVLFFIIAKQVSAKENYAVADFVGKNVSAADASIVADFIRTELVSIGKYNVVEKANMNKILAEVAFQQTGCTESECAVQIGRILNVQKMVVGSLSKLEGIYYITANIVDVATGKIENSKSAKCKLPEELMSTAQDLTHYLIEGKTEKPERIVERKTGDIQITNIDGKRVQINKGSNDKIEKRQIYNVYAEKVKVGKMKITNVDQKESTGKIVRIYDKNVPVEVGNTVIDTGRKYKTGGIGLTGGYGLIVPMREDRIRPSMRDSWGGGIYYDFVAPSGLGFQLNLTGYPSSSRTVLWDYLYEHVTYRCPLIVKYHLFYDTELSPYFGLGVYYNYTKAYELRYYQYYQWYKREKSLLPVFNAGVEFFAQRKVHFSADVKFFIGESTPGCRYPSLICFSPALGYHW
ncbi:MAG: CsgG/HfaB family protein [Elusimicrobiota bacterium]